MASVANDPNGRRRILFTAPDGTRKTVRLGKLPKKDAEQVARHVEHLLAARAYGAPVPRPTAARLESVGEPLRDRLAAAGLADAPARAPTLGGFLDGHLELRAAALKPSTMKALGRAARWLKRALGEATPIDKVGPADADRYRAFLLAGRGRATANKWTRYAREFFAAAVRGGLVAENPFAHIRGVTATGNAARRVLVPAADIDRVLETIPCAQFRLAVALPGTAACACRRRP